MHTVPQKGKTKTMSFSTDRLNTLEECEAVLASARLELKEFQTQLGNIDFRQERKDNTVQKNAAALVVNRAQVQGYEVALSSITNPEARAVITNRLTKVRNRVENLEADATAKGIVSILKMELDIAQLEGQITITENFIAQVEAKKATLTV
jgi:hypothetical protein